MNKLKTLKNNYYIILLLFFFITSFYGFNNIYLHNKKKIKTFTLDENIFENTSLNNKNAVFTAINLLNINFNFIISNPNLIDSNLLLFTKTGENINTSTNNTVELNKVYNLEIKSNNITKLLNNKNLRIIDLKPSPNNEKFLCTVETLDHKFKAYLYDNELKKIINIFDNVTKVSWFPDSNSFLGVDSCFFIQNLTHGNRINLSKFRDIPLLSHHIDFRSKVYELSSIIMYRTGNYKMSLDGNKLYFTFDDYLYMLDIKNNLIKPLLNNVYIDKLIPLSNGNLVFNGFSNYGFGLYIYNTQTKNLNNILRGNIKGFDINSTGNEIVYAIATTAQDTNFYVAYFNGTELKCSTLIYHDTKLCRYIQWGEYNKNIFFLCTKNTTSTLYKFAIDKTS